MTTSTRISDLPTVEQRATAARLRQLLREAGAHGPPPASVAAPYLAKEVPLLPSRVLWEAMDRGFGVLNRAGLLHGRLRDLGAEGQHWRLVVSLALEELGKRESVALAELSAHPPAYLVAAIGRPGRPELGGADSAQSPWLEAAGHIVGYRLQYGISDPTRALGVQPAQSVGLAQEMDWRFVMGEIRWSAGNLGERLADPAVLAVFDPAGRVDPQRTLEALSAGPSSERIGGGRERRIRAAPSHLLRERVGEALDLLRQRPPDRLSELEQLEAIRRATEVLYKQELAAGAHLRSEPATSGATQVRRDEQLSRRLDELDRAIAGERRAWREQTAWGAQHADALALGRLAAEELGQRESEALLALEEDPPRYLLAELGAPPASMSGRTTWRHGARLIERHRTRHEIGDPEQAFGSGRDPAMRDQLALIRRQVALVRDALHLARDDTLALPQPPSGLLPGP
jgi:hypothetical protein